MSSAVVHTAEDAGHQLWDFVVGLGFLAALKAPAPGGVLQALDRLIVQSSPSAESIVGVIPVDIVESFGVVTWEQFEGSGTEVKVSVIVRGDAVVDVASVGGSRRFSDGGIRPWNLADFGAVTGVTMTGRDAPLASAKAPRRRMHPDTGIVHATRLHWSAAGGNDDSEQAIPAEDTILRPRRSTGVEDTRILARAVDSTSVNRTADADTILDIRTITDPPDPVQEPDQATGTATAEPFAPRAVGRRAERHVASPIDPAVPSVAIRIGTHQPVAIDRPLVIGRRPLMPRILSGPQPRLITVPSATGAVSSTHLEVRMEGAVIVITDLRSTNGTFVLHRSGSRRLRPGESIVVTTSTRIDIGDGTIVEIIATDDDVSVSDQSRRRPE